MRITYNAPVILTYTFLCTGLLALSKLMDPIGESPGDLILDFFTAPGDFNPAIPAHYFRLFSHVLGHADWDHLIGNFTIILLIGPMIEEKYGTGRLLLMMTVTALVTGGLFTLFWDENLMGGSGVAFMLIILSSLTGFKQGRIPLTFLLVFGFFVGKEVLSALNQDNISQFAHIIGGICGGVFGFFFVKQDEEPPNPDREPLSPIEGDPLGLDDEPEQTHLPE